MAETCNCYVVRHASYAAYLIERYGNPMRRALIRVRQQEIADRAYRPRLRRMHSAYRARTRGRSRRG